MTAVDLPATLVTAWRSRTEPVVGGHLHWKGARDVRGTAKLTYRGVRWTAQRIAFVLANGAEPVGRVQAGCDYPGCVEPSHIDDYERRQRDRAALRLVVGKHRIPAVCRGGLHDLGVTGVWRSDGRLSCTACNAATRARAAA